MHVRKWRADLSRSAGRLPTRSSTTQHDPAQPSVLGCRTWLPLAALGCPCCPWPLGCHVGQMTSEVPWYRKREPVTHTAGRYRTKHKASVRQRRQNTRVGYPRVCTTASPPSNSLQLAFLHISRCASRSVPRVDDDKLGCPALPIGLEPDRSANHRATSPVNSTVNLSPCRR